VFYLPRDSFAFPDYNKDNDPVRKKRYKQADKERKGYADDPPSPPSPTLVDEPSAAETQLARRRQKNALSPSSVVDKQNVRGAMGKVVSSASVIPRVLM
jgi:hypothetical protein